MEIKFKNDFNKGRFASIEEKMGSEIILRVSEEVFPRRCRCEVYVSRNVSGGFKTQDRKVWESDLFPNEESAIADFSSRTKEIVNSPEVIKACEELQAMTMSSPYARALRMPKK